MSRWSPILFAAIPLLALAACVDAEEDLGTSAQAVIPCPKLWGCGENSPMMGPFSSHEFRTDGLPNGEDVRVLGLYQGGTVYQPRIVAGSRLAGYDPVTSTWIQGAALTNAYFMMLTPQGLWKITVKKVSPLASSFTTFWVGPATAIETYELTTNKYNATDPVPLCNNPPDRETGEGPGRIIARPFEAMFLSGDRYDAAKMEVSAIGYRETAPWFNIACAGSALAKLHLNRHTTPGAASGWLTDQKQRQAMLKMYVSDVCGIGYPFTRKGTKLHWENTTGWSHLTGTEYAHEAMWTEMGALCLDTHRLWDEYRDEIDDTCHLEACSAINAPPGSYYITTAVPTAPPP